MFPGQVPNNASHVHEFELDLAEECIFGLQAAMLDGFWAHSEAFKKLSDYTQINPADETLSKAYEYYKNALKCIFYKGKSPHF